MQMSRTKLILLSLGMLVMMVVARTAPNIMPDGELSAVTDHLLSGTSTASAERFASRHRMSVAKWNGTDWDSNLGARDYPNKEVMTRLFERPTCSEPPCEFYFAERIDNWGLGTHHYRYLWAQKEGRVIAVIADHDLW